jgi:isocitrate dehydrogenase (NAD+)
MMLRHIGEPDAGDRLEAAIVSVIAEGVHVPRDLRGPGDTRPPAGTFQAADAVIARL